MQVIVTKTFDGASDVVAEMIADLVRSNPTAKLGLATGSTPEGVYERLARMCANGLDFSKVSTVNLNEYRGIPGDNPISYRYFIAYSADFPHYSSKSSILFKSPYSFRENICAPASFRCPQSEKQE